MMKEITTSMLSMGTGSIGSAGVNLNIREKKYS